MTPMSIQHFSHKHPLTLEIIGPDTKNCSACGRICSGPVYSCGECEGEGYVLHKSCAELPKEITQHPFHPFHPLPLVIGGAIYACCGCGKWDHTLLYCCQACDFTLSPDCALKPTTKYELLGQGRIRHFLHKHPLMRLMDIEEGDDSHVCTACEKPCLGGAEISYACQQCPEVKLHKSCAERLPQAIQHPSHPQHPMILRAKDSMFGEKCVTCEKTDCALTYRCSMCSVDMDPECALETSETIV